MPEMIAPGTGGRCAIIGSGPAGLACAGELARLGHEVTVFESLHAAGGVLVYGIPEFRLPKSIVSAEIALLERMGVTVVTNHVVGRLSTIEELIAEQGFKAVFVGSGAGLPVFMGVSGENLAGVYSANEFLTRVNLMRAYEFPRTDTPIKRGRRVVVVGGGNVAMDAARTAIRLGAEQVVLMYRRTEREMPARREEVAHALEEGVRFEMLAAPTRVIGHDGWVIGVKAIRMELGEADFSGRRSPVPVSGSEFNAECDTVIIAVGSRANPLVASAAAGIAISPRGYVVADEDGATSLPGVWAGGDIVTGAATVILAMGAGKRAAAAMDRALRAGTGHV